MLDQIIPFCPDFLLRWGIRRISQMRINQGERVGIESLQEAQSGWLDEIKTSPIAIETKAANDQHYEVPARFFELTLGRNLKYSSAYFDDGVTSLSEAEDKMLDITIQRARLEDGQDVLELGCGWGSLTIEMARRFPNSRITGVSNSGSQREHILKRAKALGLDNVVIITEDMNAFDAGTHNFDRVVSVEMFEHMRNWELLLAKIHQWLREDGEMFIHIFTHRQQGYAYEVQDDTDWMSKYFFTGGQMPSAHQFAYLQDHMKVEEQWAVSGTHYQKTAEAWLSLTDLHKDEILELFKPVYGKDAKKWFHRWRVFYMSCAEFFGMNQGNEWFVSHYRFSKRELSVEEIPMRHSA